MDLARDEETRVRNLGRLALENAAKAGASKAGSNGISRTFATVSRVNDDGTIDVSMGDYTDVNGVTSECILRGLRMTVACSGAQVGDRVIVDTYAHVSVVTGILANADNTHYVKGNVDIFTGSDVVNMNNSNWINWLSPEEQKKRFGRAINGGSGWVFVSCMNGDITAQAAAIIGTYFYPEGTIGFYTNKIINGMFRVNYLVVLGR